jgi:hypothetical protein
MSELLQDRVLNRPLLAKVRDLILNEPERFDIGYWFTSRGVPTGVNLWWNRSLAFADEQCGTTACIAGAALALNGSDQTDFVDIPGSATRALGLPDEYLFYRSDWPGFYRYPGDVSGREAAPHLITDVLDGTVKLSALGIGMRSPRWNAFWQRFAP